MDGQQFVVSITSVTTLAGVATLWIAMHSRAKARELEHRERMAMIERGLAPAPEKDPAAFEQRLMPVASPRTVRTRSAGVILIGFGLALMVLITFTVGAPEIGIGVGGAFAVLGAAFVVNSLLPGAHPRPELPLPGTERGTPPGSGFSS